MPELADYVDRYNSFMELNPAESMDGIKLHSYGRFYGTVSDTSLQHMRDHGEDVWSGDKRSRISIDFVVRESGKHITAVAGFHGVDGRSRYESLKNFLESITEDAEVEIVVRRQPAPRHYVLTMIHVRDTYYMQLTGVGSELHRLSEDILKALGIKTTTIPGNE